MDEKSKVTYLKNHNCQIYSKGKQIVIEQCNTNETFSTQSRRFFSKSPNKNVEWMIPDYRNANKEVHERKTERQ